MGTKANKLDPLHPKEISHISRSDIMEEVEEPMVEFEADEEDKSLDSEQLD